MTFKIDLISLKIEENKHFLKSSKLLSTFDNQENNRIQILQGMSSKEIADIVSNHLIDIVKKQFQVAKEKYHRENISKKTEQKAEA